MISQNINEKDENGMTPLMKSILENKSKTHIEKIIHNGADVNITENHHISALMNSTQVRKSNKEIMKLLLENGADVNQVDDFGNTALLYADHDFQKIKLLLDAGANINVQNNLGTTLLMALINNKRSNSWILYLMEKGADVNLYDKLGNHALMYVCIMYDYHDELERSDAMKIVKKLFELGVNVHQTNRAGQTTREIAVKYGWKDVVKLIEEHQDSNPFDTLRRKGFIVTDHSENKEEDIELDQEDVEPINLENYRNRQQVAYLDDSAKKNAFDFDSIVQWLSRTNTNPKTREKVKHIDVYSVKIVKSDENTEKNEKKNPTGGNKIQRTKKTTKHYLRKKSNKIQKTKKISQKYKR